MARANVGVENAALGGIAGQTTTNQIPYGSLHTADTSTTGANEMASVTRIASTWNAPASGSMTNSAAETYSTPGTSAATYFGQWSAVSAGTFGIGGALGSSVQATSIVFAAGSKTVTAA